ncbi:MAG: hypothetical protein IPO22_15360 [Anaerolineales bacterium]|nr:hypothetical protein [Anaerolineales bacterium]
METNHEPPDFRENLSGLNLYDWDNLLLAYRKASKGKRGLADVAEFEYKLEDNLLQLQRELQEQTYQPGEYHSFYIHDPKKRLISAAPFRDRVVHHALCNIIEPCFERSFIFDPLRQPHRQRHAQSHRPRPAIFPPLQIRAHL